MTDDSVDLDSIILQKGSSHSKRKYTKYPNGPAVAFREEYGDTSITWMELRKVNPGLARSLLRTGEKELVFPAFRGYTLEDKKEILAAHPAHNGNCVEAAKALGKPQRTIYKIWNKAGLPGHKAMQRTLREHLKEKKVLSNTIEERNGNPVEVTRKFSSQHNYIQLQLVKEWQALEERVYPGDKFLFDHAQQRIAYFIHKGWRFHEVFFSWKYQKITKRFQDKKELEEESEHSRGTCKFARDHAALQYALGKNEIVEHAFTNLRYVFRAGTITDGRVRRSLSGLYVPHAIRDLQKFGEKNVFPDYGEIKFSLSFSEIFLGFHKSTGITLIV
jgi:hypothetical protein